MRVAALPPGRNRQESRHAKAPPVHLHERRTRRPNRRSPALNRPRPKWKPSCESRSSTTGRGYFPGAQGAAPPPGAGTTPEGERIGTLCGLPLTGHTGPEPLLDVRRKAQGIPEEVAGPAEKQEQEELRKKPTSKGTRPTDRPRPSDNTPDPSCGSVGIDPPETHTFLQTILLPEPIRKGKKAKGRPRPEKVKQPVRKARKPKEPRKPSTEPSLKKEKPDHQPQPDENWQETNIGGPAAHQAKLLQRREYDRIKNKSPERIEYQRLYCYRR